MQAIILAAGMGKRLKELTQNNTKCMVRVNGETLIERVLRQLDRLHLSRIVIVVGYEGKKLIEYIGTLEVEAPICYVDNPIYDKTNNIYSLALAKEYLLMEDTILLESDLIFEDSVLETLVNDERDTLALVDKYESWMDGTVIKIDEYDNILEFVPGKKFVFKDIPYYYKTVNIYKFSRHFSESHYVPFLEAYSKALGNNEYYEQVLRVIAMLDDPGIKAKRLDGQIWYEIDDIQDLDIASSLFAKDGEDKMRQIQKRFGGYWRYPKMKDFCYLVNPYFPPQKLIHEMEANFESLLTQYPSGMRVNSLLAARNFGVKEEHILVGNGAAELIKSLMNELEGKMGIVRPTFEEYPNRYNAEDIVAFIPYREDFSYTADDIKEYFADKGLQALLLVNPDNPTGNYISFKEMISLMAWAAKNKIILIVDESFADFADEENNSLIKEDILTQNLNLIVIKSVSKSYGVPGVRLGVMASGNRELIAKMKKDVAIWNINSFGEFYMQIAGKYQKDYENSLVRIKRSRSILIEKLSEIENLRVIPSQANYLCVELLDGISSNELTERLLTENNILIKDLSEKMGQDGRQFVRIAVRNDQDNEMLVRAIKQLSAI